MASLARKLIQGSLFRVLMPVSNIIVTFFMMPFVIGHLGDRWYGLWILAATFVGYYGLLDLGLTKANERFISRALGREEAEEVDIVFNTCLGLFICAAILTVIASLVIVIVTPHFVDNVADARIFRIVTLIIGVTMAISFPIRAYNGFLHSHIRFDVVNIMAIIKLVLRTALIVYFLSRGFGIIALAYISFAVEVAQGIVTIYYVNRNYPELDTGRRFFQKSRIRSILGYSIYSFLATVGERLRFHLSALIITAFLGLSLVTHYNIGSRVANYYLLMISSAIALVMPVFSRLEGQNDYNSIRKNYLFVTKLNTILSVFAGGSILIYGKAFLLCWMGPEYSDSWTVLVILVIGLLFNTIQIASKTVLFSLSKHRMYAITVTVEGVANLLLSLILIRKYGIFGVAMGAAIPMLVTNIFIIPTYTNRVIGMRITRYARIVLGTMLLGAAVHLASWYVIRGMISTSYAAILVPATVTSVVFLMLNTFIVLNREERSQFKIPF